MTPIDSLLPHIIQNISAIQAFIPKKDKRILVSLAKQLSSGIFLTENQAKLFVKILNENLKAVKGVIQDIETTLATNFWSKDFRVVQKVRKLAQVPDNQNLFLLEFSFNTRLREKFTKISPKITGQIMSIGSKYLIQLNEANINLVVSTFIKDGFEIDQKIMDFYQEIEEIRKNTKHPFEIFSTSHEKLKKSVLSDVSDIAKENVLMLQDRKIRYQYEISEKSTENSLTAKIAQRPTRKIYVNPQEISFVNVVTSLHTLRRLPLLVIFEGHSAEKDKKTLKLVEDAVSTLSLGDEIGIYFRYDKGDDTAHFNRELLTLGYNKDLGDKTVIAGISNNKLPKFMLKTGWKPQSVISFSNSFRANKASVYCTDVDLIVYYTATQPLNDTIHALM